MKIGTNDIVDCKIGITQVNKVYLGSNLVWEFGSAPSTLLDGLVSYYKLDENSTTTVTDSVGANNGSMVGFGYTPFVSGKIDKGISFNGSDGAVDCGNNVSLQLSTGSISVWFKSPDSGSSYRAIVVKQLAYSIYCLDGVLGIYSWGGVYGQSSAVNICDNTWHHIVLNFDVGAGQTKLYLDNNLVLTGQNVVLDQTQPLNIAGANYPGQYVNGLIDEVAIYNRILNLDEITELYNLGAGLTYPF